MNKTRIDWCDATWNPVWGCRNSCPYCYARRTAERFGKSFEPHWMERNFNRAMPKEPSRIFVNSMSDVAYWELDWWERVVVRIDKSPQHVFLFLTKEPEIYFNRPLPMNCWLGVTVTRIGDLDQYQDGMGYLPNLCFLSIEPILEYIDPERVDTEYVQWVIIGAETGNRKDKVVPPPEWIAPWLKLELPLFMKNNLPWSGEWRREWPDARSTP